MAPPVVVGCGDAGEIAAAKARVVARLREAGDDRAVVFDREPIVTGVPRSVEFLDRARDGSVQGAEQDRYAKAFTPDESVSAPLPKPSAPPPKLSAEPKRVRMQVRRPDPERDDPGEVIEGYYDVSDGLVYVWNEKDAEPIGREPIHPGDDPTVIARRILREKSGKHLSFYQPLKYPPLAQIRS